MSLSIHGDYRIESSSGVVEGYKKGRVLYWDDIPYAKPPINELRWKAPRKITDSTNLYYQKNKIFVFKGLLLLVVLGEMDLWLELRTVFI